MNTHIPINSRQFWLHILNGVAIGTVAGLMPSALLNVPLKLLAEQYEIAGIINVALIMTSSMLGMVIGVMSAINFKMTPIQTISVGLASLLAGGAGKYFPDQNVWGFSGTGDVITIALTAGVAIWFIQLIEHRVRHYVLLLVPLGTVLCVGVPGMFIRPYIMEITTAIGSLVEYFITLQPLVMCILIAMLFSLLILSPVSSVIVALAIGLSGLGAGAGNVGVCATAFSFCVAGWGTNSVGTCLAHWLGSPKISMVNAIKKPVILVPILINAGIMGTVAYLLNLTGTPFSAGFGFSGFLGPAAAIDASTAGWTPLNVLYFTGVYGGLPVVIAVGLNFVFRRLLGWISPEDYKLEIR